MITYKNTKIVILQSKGKGPIVLGGNLLVNLPGVFRGTNFHLYLTSDVDINTGDWYIDDTSTVRQSVTSDKEYWSVRTDYKKIIATTDSSLFITEQNRNLGQTIIQLPQLSQSFINHYVTEYNKGIILTKAQVEYDVEPIMEFSSGNTPRETLHINPDNTINIK